MRGYRKILTTAVLALIAACASTPHQDATAPAPAAPPTGTTIATSPDGRTKGEIIGTPAPGSRFAYLRIGMSMQDVQDIMKHAPDRTDSHETGKRWIPFYFGPDARRLEALYNGEGCLSFTGGNIWGGSGGELLKIEVSPSGACFDH